MRSAELNKQVIEQIGAGDTVTPREAVKTQLVALLDSIDRHDKGEGQINIGGEHAENFIDGIDSELEDLLAIAAPLIEYGGLAGQEAVVSALARVAEQIPRETQTPGWEPALFFVTARLLWSTAAIALACDAVEFFPRLLRVRTRSRYRSVESLVVDDSSARHLDVYGRGADESFESHRRWLAELELLIERYALLVRDGLLEQALAEADMLFAMHTVATGSSFGQAYSHGAHREGHAERRLRVRVRAPEQRASLCKFFDTPDRELEQRLATLHDGLARQRDLFRGEVQLFPSDD
jgi:hypothetical protein